MSTIKPISKDYLLTQFKNFKSKILDATFVKTADVTDTISSTNSNPISSKGVAGIIDDTTVSGNTVYSSTKVQGLVDDINSTLTTVDTTPTSGSTKLVTSGGVYTALSGKSPLAGSSSLTTCSKGTFGDASTKGVTSSATSGSADLITGGGVYSALANKQDKLTNPLTKSDVVNNLTSTATDVPLSAYQGNVLNTALSKKAQFDNNTLVAVGDDVLIGDQNVAGSLIVQGNNGKGNIELRNTDGTKITSVLDMYTTLSNLGTQATMTLSGTTLTITF